MAATPITLASPEVIAAVRDLEDVQLAPRTLADWAARDIAVPSFWDRKRGRAHARRYTFADFFRVIVIVRLRALGVSMQRIRRVLDYIDNAHPDLFRYRTRKLLYFVGDRVVVRAPGEPDMEVPGGQTVIAFDLAEIDRREAREVFNAHAG